MSNQKQKRIVIIGGTSLIAEYCARIWAKDSSTTLILVGRNHEKLQRVESDLGVRHPQAIIEIISGSMTEIHSIELIVEEITSKGQVDTVLIAQGSLPDQLECQEDLRKIAEAININAISPILFAEAFSRKMELQRSGTIALISSVAGDRGRKSNYVYGAAKGLVSKYAQGLQHRFGGTNVKIILIKPGPTDTPMTAKNKVDGIRLAPVSEVAKIIIKGINNGDETIYAPRKWKIIMMIIIHIPRFIFNKINI